MNPACLDAKRVAPEATLGVDEDRIGVGESGEHGAKLRSRASGKQQFHRENRPIRVWSVHLAAVLDNGYSMHSSAGIVPTND